MVWYNPFSWFPEDPVTRCGWYFLSVYSNPADDPYFPFCEWDDKATSKDSPEYQDVTLERHIEAGIAQISELQKKFPEDSFEHRLGEFYKTVWPHFVGLFWEGKK